MRHFRQKRLFFGGGATPLPPSSLPSDVYLLALPPAVPVAAPPPPAEVGVVAAVEVGVAVGPARQFPEEGVRQAHAALAAGEGLALAPDRGRGGGN